MSICFFPCRWPSMIVSSWMDPGNPGNSQLNNSSTCIVIFYILHFPEKLSKYEPLEKFDPPWKKVQF